MALATKHAFCPSTSSSEWPDKVVSILLRTYAQKFSADRGYLRTQDWQDVANAVNHVCDNPKTLKQCRDKVDSLKRRYKIEKRRAVTGSEVCWPFFQRLDDIMNSVLKQGRAQHPGYLSAQEKYDGDGRDCVQKLKELEQYSDEDDREEEAGGVAARGRCNAVDIDGVDSEGKKQKLDRSISTHSFSAMSADIVPYNCRALRHPEDDYGMSDEDHRAFKGYSYHSWCLEYSNDNQPGHKHIRRSHFGSHYDRRPEHAYRSYLVSHPQFLGFSRRCTLSGGTQESTENSSHDRAKCNEGRSCKRKLESDNGIDALADVVTGFSEPRRNSTSFSNVFARIEHSKIEILKKLRSEITKLDKRHNMSSTVRKPHRSKSTSC